MAKGQGSSDGGGSILAGLAILAGIGGIAWAFLSAQPASAATVASGGPYFQSFLSQITGYTNAYSQSAITLAQWTSQMQSLKVQIQNSRNAGQITDQDVATLNTQIGI